MIDFRPNLTQTDRLAQILDNNKQIAVAFTGHRPEAFGGYGEQDDTVYNVKARLYCQIEKLIKDGYSYFVGGGARGTDIWMGEAVLELKKQYPHIKLVTVVPHEGQSKGWSAKWQARYDRLMENSNFVTIISPKFTYASYHIRNRFLVDHSNLLIAIYNGTSGGTQSTIAYAQKNSKNLIIIDC